MVSKCLTDEFEDQTTEYACRIACSKNDSSWITGQVINVDGGHGLRRGPDMSGMLEPLFGAAGLRGVV
jgi:hypothetical protein